MNRNSNLLMGAVPKIHGRRSKIDRSKSVHTTFNNGQIIPIYTDCDILPGDTVQMDVASITRLATPIVPVMDNLILDIMAFFVPHRLVWEHWEAFWGENEDPWTQTTQYETPQIEAPEGGWASGTLADYMTIPTKISGISVNAFAFRSYAKIFSDWFRDENIKYAAHIYTDETTRTGTNGTNYVTDLELGGMPAQAAKTPDLFTKCLPAPQKGPSVSVPIGTKAYVYTGPEHGAQSPSFPEEKYGMGFGMWNVEDGTFRKFFSSAGYQPIIQTGQEPVTPIQAEGYLTSLDTTTRSNTGLVMTPTNLYADLTNATAATINELRTAFAIQKYYEAAARYGSRYIEFIRAIFQTESSDARLQRSEYLGGTRIPINMDAITQTSSTDATTPQGNAAGYSCTRDKSSLFTKSFEEHGTLLILAIPRVDKRSYQQGLHKMFTRKKWSDYYNPFFANLGEQPVYLENIYAQGTDNDKEVFGYQEAWAEYRYAYNDITGDMRSNATNGSLDVYHYGDKYTEAPSLSEGWIDEPKTNVDRTIAVTSQKAHQFVADFYFKCSYTRLMPIYSMPGLIDHV